MNVKAVKINDIYTITRGKSKYTKEYCKDKAGEFPLYSANNTTPHCLVNFYDYEGTYLTVSVNGIAGVVTMKTGKFSCTSDRVVLIPKNTEIVDEYILSLLQPILRTLVKGRIGEKNKNEFSKLELSALKNAEVFVPVTENGDFDILLQRKIAQKYQTLCKYKENLNAQKNKIANAKVLDLTEYEKKSVCILDMIDRIETSYLGWGTAKLHSMNTKCKSDYSVWSAAENPIAYINENINGKLIFASDERKILSISANGDGSAGRNFFIHTEPFYMDSGRIAVIPNAGVEAEYLFYALKGMKEKYGFCRAKPVNKTNLREVCIEVPISADGIIDNNAMTTVVNKCKIIDQIKQDMVAKIDEILSIPIRLWEE